MIDLDMTIAGRPASGARYFEVENPATGEVCGSAPECSIEQLDEAMIAAGEAFEPWQNDADARRSALGAAAGSIDKALEELAALITREQGKPLSEARGELAGSAEELRYYAQLVASSEILHDDERARVEVIRRPVGPVAAITPWNYPLGSAIAKLAPALLAGCPVVLKPSPLTPLTSLRFAQLTREVFPPGVLNVVSGGNELGEAMCLHPVPRHISFTGSVATGKKVSTAAAPDLKRLTLELGGNDPAIVLDDVDVNSIVGPIFKHAFANCGQVCVAIKRLYVPEHLYAEVVEALVARAEAAIVGDGSYHDTEIGPLTSEAQRGRVAELVDDALSSGATIATGGRRLDGVGHFYQPTVVTNVEDGVRLVDEEQFGPALPVISYRHLDDAIERANRTHFGLGASVWTGDPERGASLVGRIAAGTVWVNTHHAAVPGQPAAGLKWSGLGVEGGRWGLLAYTDVQALHVSK